MRGNMGTTYKVYQAFEGGSVVSDTGEDFDLTKIRFASSGSQYGNLTQSGDLKLAKQKQLLYISDTEGTADNFVVSYKPEKDFRFQKAGTYRGRLNFIIEKDLQGGAPEVIETLDVEIEITPLFEMFVYTDGKEGVSLKFGEVSHKTGPKTSDVDVYVESNMGKPYQVMQKVAGPMVNSSGDKVPAENFTVQIKDIVSNEDPRFYITEPISVKEGESVIFSSGLNGENAHFKTSYQLAMQPDSKGGNYSTEISYSLSMN